MQAHQKKRKPFMKIHFNEYGKVEKYKSALGNMDMQECFDMLDRIRESGLTNMYDFKNVKLLGGDLFKDLDKRKYSTLLEMYSMYLKKKKENE